ncbi:uncharacterized protein [Nicotiana tomentosiformis]|uniref:uncharacterized protein n=1 Tax=Nicotiana tomentosiformis TaxID=4098 RepID=UPI00388C6668
MDKEIRKLILAKVQSEPQETSDFCGLGHPTHECQASAEEVNAVGNFNRGNYQGMNNYNAMGQRHPKPLTETIKVVSLRSGKALTDPVVKARPEMVNKQTKTPAEKKSEEKKGQSSGVQKDIKESRHMPDLPFSQKMKREKFDKYFGRFLEMLKQLYVNIPFTEVLTQMPAYAKFLKEILSSKRKLEKITVVKLNAYCSAILQKKIPQKKLEGELGVIKSIPVSLKLADQTTILPEGIIEDILVQVDKFVFFVDFIVVNIEVNNEVPLILGRPFLCTCRAILDIYEGKLMLRVGNEKVVFQMKRMIKYPSDEASAYSCFNLDIVGKLAEKYKLDKLVGNTIERCITQSSTVEDGDPEIKKEAEALETADQVVDEEELKEEDSKPNMELKVLPSHLKYAFLETNNFSMIISADLTGTQEQKLVELLKKHKKAIGWGITDIQGISPAICMHKIQLEKNSKPVVRPQRKLNKNLEVVLKEIIKLLDAGVIFPISDSQWISPVQVVPKGSMTVVKMKTMS